jgi:hypothetical protein
MCFFIFNHALQHLGLIVRCELKVPTFATRRLHACHHARAPSGGRWNCGRKMSGKFCLNAYFHVKFRDLLHTVKLRHGTDERLYFPYEGRRAEDSFALKIWRLRPTVNPRTWVPKASTLPLDHWSRYKNVLNWLLIVKGTGKWWHHEHTFLTNKERKQKNMLKW